MPGDPDETGETFETNAAIKARFGARATGLPTLADDSGIEVDALDGAPGVRTRRYAGEDATDEQNNDRAARGASAACRPSGAGRATSASWRWPCRMAPGRAAGSRSSGRAGRAAAGSPPSRAGPGGFGYDPIFEPASEPPGGRTLGLWTPAEKHAISHRARAARRLAPRLRELGF